MLLSPCFKTIVAALTSRFEPEDQSELYRSDLKNRFRKKDETLTEFAQDIKRLMRLAYPNTDMHVSANLGRNALEDSLRDPDMEWAVHQGKPKPTETAFKLAPLRVQNEEPVQGNRNGNNSRNRNHDIPRNPKACICCGRKGHVKKACDAKTKSISRTTVWGE